MRYFEDFKVGDRFTSPGKTMTDAIVTTVVNLAGFTLAQFHDEEFAKKTRFGRRIAPARFTLLMMGALEEQSPMWADTEVLMVGLDKVKVPAPLFPGDTIRVVCEVIETRETSNPERGLVRHKSQCLNQKNEVICESESVHLVKRRPR